MIGSFEISFVLSSNGKLYKKRFDYGIINNCQNLFKYIVIIYKENINNRFEISDYDLLSSKIYTGNYNPYNCEVVRHDPLESFYVQKELNKPIRDWENVKFDIIDQYGLRFQGEQLTYKFNFDDN